MTTTTTLKNKIKKQVYYDVDTSVLKTVWTPVHDQFADRIVDKKSHYLLSRILFYVKFNIGESAYFGLKAHFDDSANNLLE